VRFEVETGRRRRTIEVRRSGNGWIAVVDGRTVAVDLARVGDRWSMLVRRIEAGDDPQRPGTDQKLPRGESHEIGIERQGRGRHIAHVDGRIVPVTLLAPGRGGSASGATTEKAAGPIQIVSPMPGRIVKVLVKTGDVVAPRQGLLVVEAMKMENELRAPRAGTVTEVRVSEGAPVEANVVLAVIT
jgi:biotin carboxyl carrier protein